MSPNNCVSFPRRKNDRRGDFNTMDTTTRTAPRTTTRTTAPVMSSYAFCACRVEEHVNDNNDIDDGCPRCSGTGYVVEPRAPPPNEKIDNTY